MNAATIARLKPYLVQVEKGKSYLWCACELSKRQPFCDGTHNSLSDTYAEADEADGAGAELVNYQAGEGGVSKARLDNGCYVIRVPAAAMKPSG